MKERRTYIYQIFAVFLMFATAGDVAVFAQTKNAAKTAKCSGAWTGNITYTKTIASANSKTEKRVSNRGEDRKSFEMSYNYRASVAVTEAPERNGSNVGKARIEHSFKSLDKTNAREENSCDRGKTFQVMTGEFQSKTEARANASGVGASVSVVVSGDGTYAVSVGLPQIKGIMSGTETASYAGQCQIKPGKNVAMPATATTVDGSSMTSNGSHRVDPQNPNRLSGSWTQSGYGSTETITWSLEKCGAPLRITELQFEDMKYPNWNDWQEIVEQKGTIDGNLVRIKAKILNESGETKYADVRFKETFKGDKWDGARPDAPMTDSVVSVRVDPNSEAEAELVWDSSGYAWFDDGRPRLLQRIKAELEENSKKIDEETKNLKVAPKPLVLVHGLWSNADAWTAWQNLLTISHSYDWKAYAVGEKPEHGKMNTGGRFLSTDPTKSIGENADELKKYIEYAQTDRNAWHVDLVAHSLGGLISRHYISQQMENNSQDGRPRVSHFVMLGTPNLGSPCADVMNVAFEMLGKNVEAVRQLRQDYVQNFNKINKNRKGVKFSALAGNPLPNMCKEIIWNDGVVSVPSAKWIIGDTAESSSIHTDLTGAKDFSDFVKPRIAIGPKGDHNPATPEVPSQTGAMNGNSAMFLNASFAPVSSNSFDLRPDFAKAARIAPKQSVEIEIPVGEAQNLGLTFMADPNISATLFDANGAVVGKNLAKTPEASGWFRSIFVDRPTKQTTWKLRLENIGDKEFEAVVAAWSNAVR